jgi:hypothetical protein
VHLVTATQGHASIATTGPRRRALLEVALVRHRTNPNYADLFLADGDGGRWLMKDAKAA